MPTTHGRMRTVSFHADEQTWVWRYRNDHGYDMLRHVIAMALLGRVPMTQDDLDDVAEQFLHNADNQEVEHGNDQGRTSSHYRGATVGPNRA